MHELNVTTSKTIGVSEWTNPVGGLMRNMAGSLSVGNCVCIYEPHDTLTRMTCVSKRFRGDHGLKC